MHQILFGMEATSMCSCCLRYGPNHNHMCSRTEQGMQCRLVVPVSQVPGGLASNHNSSGHSRSIFCKQSSMFDILVAEAWLASEHNSQNVQHCVTGVVLEEKTVCHTSPMQLPRHVAQLRSNTNTCTGTASAPQCRYILPCTVLPDCLVPALLSKASGSMALDALLQIRAQGPHRSLHASYILTRMFEHNVRGCLSRERWPPPA